MNYTDEVKRTIPSGICIPKISGKEAHIIHAITGLLNEYHEVMCADDPTKRIEEVGDFLWYFQYLKQYANIESVTYTGEDDPHPVLETFSSVVKARLFYDKKMPNPTFAQIKTLEEWVRKQLISSVEELNIEKLRKRYPDGFSKKDAIARRDKNED